MFRKLRDRLDPKYTKICLYAGVTAVLVVAARFCPEYVEKLKESLKIKSEMEELEGIEKFCP